MVTYKDVLAANDVLKNVVIRTPMRRDSYLSEKYDANIYLKQENVQKVRSFKLRGAYYAIHNLPQDKLKCGVVCASAGNHAQGVAFSCCKLGIRGVIYMPATTPRQKINQVRMFGKEFVEIVLTGDTFDAAYEEAKQFCQESGMTFIHPFDDPKIIEGQATVGIEIMQDIHEKIDYIFIPIGGGGLASGVGAYFRQVSPETKIIGVEPAGAQSMRLAFDKGEVATLETIDSFIDGAAVKRVGDNTYSICKEVLDDLISVPEGAVCSTILELYNKNAIVAEPAGALLVAALNQYSERIKGKNVVCIVSGSNNDITRMEEIRERSLLHEGLKHYFIIRFPQRSGALLAFIRDVLGPKDDITHFAYSKKNNREQGPAVIGVELADASDFPQLIARMDKKGIVYQYLNDNPDLFGFLIL